MADHSFFQYERTLQKEAEPELAISIPPLLERAASEGLRRRPAVGDQEASRVPGDQPLRDPEGGTQETSGPASEGQAPGGNGPSQSTPPPADQAVVPGDQAAVSGGQGAGPVPSGLPPLAPSRDAQAKPSQRQLRIIIEYSAGPEGGALRFCDGYAITDNQVRGALEPTGLLSSFEYLGSIFYLPTGCILEECPVGEGEPLCIVYLRAVLRRRGAHS